MNARPRIQHERGLAVLAVVMTLLLTMSLALLWSSRSLIFEHRAAGNQERSVLALAAAESGLAWAQARLNQAGSINAACEVVAATRATGETSFRQRYAGPWVAVQEVESAGARGAFVSAPDRHAAAVDAFGFAPAPAAHARAQCRLDAGSIECRCPDAAAASAPPHAALVGDGAHFMVELTPVERDPQALWLVARACSGPWEGCAAGPSAQTEAQVAVRVQLRLAQVLAERADAARHVLTAPLAIVASSWRDGRCRGEASVSACDFEP